MVNWMGICWVHSTVVVKVVGWADLRVHVMAALVAVLLVWRRVVGWADSWVAEMVEL